MLRELLNILKRLYNRTNQLIETLFHQITCIQIYTKRPEKQG